MAAPASPSPEMASESFIVPSESLTASTLDSTPDSPSAERQGLLEALEQAHAALAQSRSENDDLKEQLEASQRQVQDQSDQIAMLRGKVEEARRGVMRLQTENRRQSQLQLASTQDGVAGLRSSKRASFILPPTPASPGGASSAGKHIHRRISSMSDPGHHGEPAQTASPPSFITSFPDIVSGHVTPPTPGLTAEEVATLRAELTSAQKALQEATDAREASETAVRALREFIAENAVGESNGASGSSEGLQGLRLPPLPTDVDVADEEASAAPPKPEAPKRGWGGWLKREPSTTIPKAPTHTSTPSIMSVNEDEEAPAPSTGFVSTWTRNVGSTSGTGAAASPNGSEQGPISPAVPQQQGAFRKFSFFNKVSPIQTSQPPSQIQSQCEPEPEQEELAKHVPPPLQLHREGEGSVRDSISSASVSDAVEPVSPPAELVDIALDRGKVVEGKGHDEFAGERTPTVGSVTGFAM